MKRRKPPKPKKPIPMNCWQCACGQVSSEGKFWDSFMEINQVLARCRKRTCKYYYKRLGRAEQPRSTSRCRPAFKIKLKGV